MSDFPGRAFGPLNVWRDPAAPAGEERWLFLPNAPAPQRTPDGKPQITLVEAGDMTMLVLGTVLFPEEAALAEARAAIAHETKGSPDDVRLGPAAVAVTGATLLLAREDGAAPVELARAQPSPMPPYSAAFSAMLRGDAAKGVAAARHGKGRITVRYAVDLPETRVAVATLDGDPGSALDVREAIEAGALRISVEADRGASEALVKDARDGVVAEAARLFAMFAAPHGAAGSGPAAGDERDADGPRDDFAQSAAADDDADPADADTQTRQIHAAVRKTEVVPRQLTLEADLTDWM